jgi:hypothetical protein
MSALKHGLYLHALVNVVPQRCAKSKDLESWTIPSTSLELVVFDVHKSATWHSTETGLTRGTGCLQLHR